MIPHETLKLLTIVKDAQTILILGNDDPAINTRLRKYDDKTIHDIPDVTVKYDLVVVNNRSSKYAEHMQSYLADDSYVVVINYLNTNYTGKMIDAFVDKNLMFIQVSRQMMVNGQKDKNLLLKYNRNRSLLSDRSDPITILLVYKSGGGVYDHRYVNATARSIKNNITYAHELVCITDDPSNITEVDRIIRFKHNFPKWWGKVELFRDDITTNKHCLFVDLDTVIIDNIDPICKLDGAFFGIRDFYNLSILQTGLLKWEVGQHSTMIYEEFINSDFSKYINKGDHEWIGTIVKDYDYIQDCLPGFICSYKKQLAYIANRTITPSIICFHGEPRPHTIKYDFITTHWKY